MNQFPPQRNQPTELVWFLSDFAPRGYYLNDLSLLVLDETNQVIGSILGGARRDVSCHMVMEAGKEYLLIPISFRASKGPFVVRLYSASPVEVKYEIAEAPVAWLALQNLLMAPKPKTQMRFQRMAYDFRVGEVVVIEADSMALGLAVNPHPSTSLVLRFVAAGNHTVLRTQKGMQEGRADEERNKRQSEFMAKAKAKTKRGQGKANWRLYDVEVSIPPNSQSLAFVAVAQLDTWEFSLEKMEANQDVEKYETPVSSSSAFAPLPSHLFRGMPNPLADEFGEDDAELQAAILASQNVTGPYWSVFLISSRVHPCSCVCKIFLFFVTFWILVLGYWMMNYDDMLSHIP